MPHKVPQQQRARVTYGSVVDAAARILATRGYAELTTNHVAHAAGVAIGSVYEYFPDKETIVAEVARRTLREMTGALAEGLESTKAVALREGLDVALRQWVALLFSIVEDRRALVSSLAEVPFPARARRGARPAGRDGGARARRTPAGGEHGVPPLARGVDVHRDYDGDEHGARVGRRAPAPTCRAATSRRPSSGFLLTLMRQ